MNPRSNFLSPVLHRALFLMVVAGCSTGLFAQVPYRPAPVYVDGGKADQTEGARLLGEFHQMGIANSYWLAIELRVMPHQGAERTVTGEIFGTRNEQGPLTRLILAGAENAKSWLIQGGPQPALWLGGATVGSPVGDDQLLQPIDGIQGTDLTPFDLQMPFLYWTDFIYEGLARVRGRPASSFILYPPADLATKQPGLTGVRVFIDTQFKQLVQAEVLGEKGVGQKTITVLDLKKVGDQWMVKSIDLRNNLTRDKTRLTVTAAALDLELPPEVFEPAQLATPPAAVPAGKIVHF